MDRNILYNGSSAPLSEPIPLRAGPLRLVYEQGDLRSICLGKYEILRRVYVAIRDRSWGTVAPVFSHVDIQSEAEQFSITYDVVNRAGEIDFAWHGHIRGEADGAITFQMEGTARSTFYKNRIGFCVLHPANLSGQDAEVEHVDGSHQQTQFAVDLCASQPVQPFASLRAIRHPVMPGVWAEVSFSGDLFEMEDQRLWTDASYKTFCTPLSLPYPVEIQAGTRVAQSVTLKLIDRRPPLEKRAIRSLGGLAGQDGAPLLIQAPHDWRPMPALGLESASHGEPLSERELHRLRALRLHHLRVELRLSEPGYAERFAQAASQARVLSIPLEAALAVSAGQPEQELFGFRRLVDDLRPEICGWLVFPAHEPYTGGNPSEEIAQLARAILKPFDPAIPLAAGTNTDFIFLKRTQLPLPWMDQVCITLNPQVHAFDNQSIIETLEAQPMVIESARRLAQGKAVVVSPVTLKPRFNPYATGPQPQPAPGQLPPQVDPRQMSLFAAGWTVGCLRAMVQAGAERVTCYETTGWRGVMEKQWDFEKADIFSTEQSSPLPRAFPSVAGSVFPLYHVLADYGEFAGGQACALNHPAPLRLSALALTQANRSRYILANHTAAPLAITLETGAGMFEAWPLDETNAESAMREPETFRQKPAQHIRAHDGVITLSLRPYGLLRLTSMA